MNGCADPKYRDMLHVWELGMLPDEDRKEFELHLLDCEECSLEAQRFSRASRLLRHDPRFRPQAGEIVPDGASERVGFRFLGGRTTRMLLAAALLLIVAVPIYRLAFPPEKAAEIVQQIKLVPVRGGEESVIALDQGGRADIIFYVEGAGWGKEYRVIITDQNNSIVYREARYRGFTGSGTGEITLPVSDLPAGIATLTISPAGDSLTVLQQYFFRVR